MIQLRLFTGNILQIQKYILLQSKYMERTMSYHTNRNHKKDAVPVHTSHKIYFRTENITGDRTFYNKNKEANP